MSKKKIISLCLVVCLLATAIGGTLAYFTDTAKNENTMTMGKVDIAQWEYQRKVDADGKYVVKDGGYELEGFTQDKMLLPATEIDANGNPYNFGAGNYDATTVKMAQVGSYGTVQVFESPNAMDKIVIVENNGNVPAYVRTIVAVEQGNGNPARIRKFMRSTTNAAEAGEAMPWFENQVGTVTIDGNNYYVYELVYEGAKLSDGTYRHEDGALPAGEKTYPSLGQIYLTNETTSEEAANLDGNNNGKLDILVLSQGVQADGWTAAAGKTVAQTALDTAFGKADPAKVAEWFS